MYTSIPPPKHGKSYDLKMMILVKHRGRRIRTAVRTGSSDGWSTKEVHSIKLGKRIFTIVQSILTSREHSFRTSELNSACPKDSAEEPQKEKVGLGIPKQHGWIAVSFRVTFSILGIAAVLFLPTKKTEVSDISMAFLGGRIVVPQTFPNLELTTSRMFRYKLSHLAARYFLQQP